MCKAWIRWFGILGVASHPFTEEAKLREAEENNYDQPDRLIMAIAKTGWGSLGIEIHTSSRGQG